MVLVLQAADPGSIPKAPLGMIPEGRARSKKSRASSLGCGPKPEQRNRGQSRMSRQRHIYGRVCSLLPSQRLGHRKQHGNRETDKGRGWRQQPTTNPATVPSAQVSRPLHWPCGLAPGSHSPELASEQPWSPGAGLGPEPLVAASSVGQEVQAEGALQGPGEGAAGPSGGGHLLQKRERDLSGCEWGSRRAEGRYVAGMMALAPHLLSVARGGRRLDAV